jgi:colanic acid/amylovoran biosynthesis glycosyltransferase
MAKLAIALPGLGVISETFIQRHVNDLMPLNTCIIAETRKKPFCGNWESPHPQLIIDEIPLPSEKTIFQRIISKTRRILGKDDGSPKTKAIGKFLKNQNTEVFLGEYLDFSLYYLPICKSRGIRFFAHAHGYDVSSRLLNPEWVKRYQLLNQADGIITMSSFSKKKLQEIGITAPIHVIPYGIRPQQSRNIQIMQDEPIRFLFSGRFVAKKAPLVALRAFALAFQLFPNIRLTMIGGGELFEKVKDEAKELGLLKYVELLGPQPNEIVLSAMLKAHVYIQHSIVCPETGDMEGLPVAILEAMAAGLPIISTRHAGIPEAVIEGENGFLVEEGDVDAMAEKMAFLAQEVELIKKISSSNQKRVAERFLWEIEKSGLKTVIGLS